MAGGIDWFRWHHGTTGDRKFPLVAKRAGARVGDVIAMWAMLLEQASASADRGHPGRIDFEAIDLALDMPEGMAQAIHSAMTSRGLIDPETSRLVAWERRQPKRERPEDLSTERSRTHRAMQRHATPEDCGATPGNANESRGTPREEESREEKTPPNPRKRGQAGEARFPEFWASWPSGDRKQDRKKCLAKWLRGGFDADADAILAHVEASKLSRKWRDGFEPAPLTYLNGERWKDGGEDLATVGAETAGFI